MGNSYSSNDYVSGSDRIDQTTNNWNIVSTDKKNNADLDFDDFLNLMIVQLQNQDSFPDLQVSRKERSGAA